MSATLPFHLSKMQDSASESWFGSKSILQHLLVQCFQLHNLVQKMEKGTDVDVHALLPQHYHVLQPQLVKTKGIQHSHLRYIFVVHCHSNQDFCQELLVLL